MLRNYFKVALRYLLRHKEYTLINILGLAVGITCCVLIMLFVRSEFSYDKFHAKADRLYRAWQHEKYQGEDFINTVTPLPMANALKTSYPEIEATCRVYGFTPMVKVNQNTFSEEARMVDSTFFRMFDFTLIQGNRDNPFPNANSMLLTEELSRKYFGSSNPMGKQVELQLGQDKVLFTVTGIAKNAPEASSIKYRLLIPFSNSKFLFSPNAHRSWFNVFTETYVLLRRNVNAATLEKKLPSMVKQQLGENYKPGGFLVHIQPITALHLDTILPPGIEPTSNPKYSYILATIGILILLVACINFITLSIGRSATRALEVGVRKVMGAERVQLIRQFWGEAFLVTFISVMVGLGLAVLLLKPFDQLINRPLSIQFDLVFILYCLTLIALIAFIAGIYPAMILSGFNPVEVLKGRIKMSSNTGWLRQSLIVGQFVASIAMIICTVVIGEQMNYLKNKDLGYKKDQVVVVPTNKPRKEGFPLAALYRTELLKHPEVAEVSISVYSFGEIPWVELGFTDDKKAYHSFQYNSIDPYFIKAMTMQMAAGRNFSPDNPADISGSAIVNEAFVKEFAMRDPVGKKLPGKFDQQIVGIVKDFNYESLHTKIRPLMMTIGFDSVLRRSENINFNAPPQPRISVRMKPGSLSANISLLERAWKAIAPNQDFEFRYLDETIAAQYQQEHRTATIVKLASGLSIFIACMGLFGLATLTVVRRTKEIGIRKVLGSSVPGIVGLLSRDFLKLVVLAALIAFPLAWWAMNRWLGDFAYRITVGWWVYFVAALAALLVAILTVGYQAMRAALSNPVNSLRAE